jgi:subtilisin family serine protease
MHSRRILATVTTGAVALTALAACADQQPVAPRMSSPLTRSANAAPAASNYLVLAKSHFGADFAAQVAALGGSVVAEHQGAGFAVVSGLSATTAAQLAQASDIARVDADAVVSLNVPVKPAQADMPAAADASATSAANPASAAFVSWQWNMKAIRADAAWAAGKLGDRGVTVAILDTGIDYDDPDLNGLVDLSRSTSFVPSDNAVRAQFFPGRNDISDFNGHGTNVAAQVSSNAVVFAGVTSRTTLMGVKVLGANGNGSFGAILNGVLYAADHGADVANMSLGGAFLKTGAGSLTSELNRVFNYAKNHGMLMVIAAGNDAEDLDHNGNETAAFCDMVHVICVSAMGPATATGRVDTPAYYTNFGRSAISVAGPGGNADAAHGFPASVWPWGPDIASWVWSFCSKTRIAGFTPTGTPVLTACAAGNRLLGFIGTSQATPHVAGLAALLVSLDGHGRPDAIRHAIEHSADDLGQPGTDPVFGKGRINVANAIAQ